MQNPPSASSASPSPLAADLNQREEVNLMRFGQAVFAAGLVAGLAERAVTFPLDTIETHKQILTEPRKNTPYVSIRRSLRHIRTEYGGFRGLYSGMSPQLVGFLPQMFVRYGVNSAIKENMFSHSYLNNGTYAKLAVAGGVAGFFESFFITPIEFLKTRLQTQQVLKAVNLASGPIDVIRRSFSGGLQPPARLGFIPALYSGHVPLIVRQSLYGAVTFTTYEWLKNRLRTTHIYDVTPFKKLLCGVVAASTAVIVAAPFDTIRARLQAGSIPPATGMIRSFMQITANEGISGLYRGSFTKMIRLSVGTGVCLVAFEQAFKALYLTKKSSSQHQQQQKIDNSSTNKSVDGN